MSDEDARVDSKTTTRSLSSCAGVIALFLFTTVSGCELVANFDRGRIGDDVAVDAGAVADAAVDSSPSRDAGVASDAAPIVVAGHVFTKQVAYIKPSNTTPGVAMNFGGSPYLASASVHGAAVALSGDGSTLAVGALNESSASRGVNGNQTQDPAGGGRASGAVYIFVRGVGDAWTQEAYLKASDASPNAEFGCSVQLSADGNVLAVGLAATHVFERDKGGWVERASLPQSTPCALSADGSTLAVGASVYTRAAELVSDGYCENAGAAWVYSRGLDDTWTRTFVKASNTSAGSFFGESVALSGDGATLAVGAPSESSGAKGLNGDQSDTSAPGTGAVYVFR